MSKHTCDRRALLRLGGVTALGLATAPWWRRRVAADPGPQARARRLLIINLSGGVRASAAFHASPLPQYNPYGLIGAAAPFALGSMLDDHPPGEAPLPDSDYVMGPDWGGVQVPKLRDSAGQFSVLGTWSQDRGDHLRARIEEPTGSASGASPGILTRVAAAYADSVLPSDIPPFHVSPAALFGAGQGELTTFVPVSLAGYYSLPSAANLDTYAVQKTGHGFATDDVMRDAFDQYKVAHRHSVAGLVARTMSQHRRDARTIGARLAEDDMAVATASLRAAALGTVDLGSNVPLTNGMLFDLMTKCLGPSAPAQAYVTQAINAALAVRLLQLGSPAVCLELSNFDFHSGERTQGPPLYNFLGRLWAALRWLLPRVPDPSGEGSLLDRTMVVTMSDFGRDKGGPSGFNGGEGTDHGADYACFYLSHGIMGAGTMPSKLVGPVDTGSYDARNQPIKYTSEQLLVTMLYALGFDPANEDWGLPTGGQPILELWS